MVRGITTLAPHISKALLHPSFDKSLRNSTTSRIWYHIFLDQFVLFTFEEEHTLLLIETVFFSKLISVESVRTLRTFNQILLSPACLL